MSEMERPILTGQQRTERQVAHFDSIADRYYRSRKAANHLLLKRLMWKQFFSRAAIEPIRRMQVLEAMCGFADGKAILEEHFAKDIVYSGFDYSGRVISLLREERPDLNVWQADVTTFTPDQERYDLVLILGGLHHVPEQAPSVVASLAKGIRPGGYFISLEPTSGNAIAHRVRESVYRKNKIFDAETERAFKPEELIGMFRSAGLEPAELEYPGLLSYILYYNPDAFPWLNLGGRRMVQAAFAIDRMFLRSSVGRFLSFATLSLWRKPRLVASRSNDA